MTSNIAEENARAVEDWFLPRMEGREEEDVFANMMYRSFLTTKE
jgi:hypothetical protein